VTTYQLLQIARDARLLGRHNEYEAVLQEIGANVEYRRLKCRQRAHLRGTSRDWTSEWSESTRLSTRRQGWSYEERVVIEAALAFAAAADFPLNTP
jgi:hypothetical protein